jgi:hypothetical protein
MEGLYRMTDTEPRSITKTDWLLIGVLLALVLPLRLWLICNTEVTARDSIGYIRYALQFESNPWQKVLKDNHQHPGYPVLVWLTSLPVRALDRETTPDNMELSAQLVNLLASLLLILPMYFLGRQFFGSTVSFWAALLYQYLPISAQHLSDGISEPMYLVLLVTGLLQAVHAVRDRQAWRCALCGLFTGLAYLTRPEGALILPAFGCALIAMQLRPAWRCSWQRFLACGTAAAVSAALVGSIYVSATGGITNKPASKYIIHGGEPTPTQQIGLGGHAHGHLFAATFPATDNQALRLQRSIWALISEINQGFHYLASIPALLGLCWSFGTLRRQPGFWVMAAYATLHSFILIALAMVASYLSDRHVMILVLCGCYFVVVGLRELPRRILALCKVSTITDKSISVWKAWFRSAPAWFAILFVALIAFGLPKSMQRLHGNRSANHAAGLWLSEQLKEGDIILDDHSWSHFFAGQVFQEGQDPALPLGKQPKCYVVTTRSRDPLIDQQRQGKVLAPDAKVVAVWPEHVGLEQARVVVYVQQREYQKNPWRVASRQ